MSTPPFLGRSLCQINAEITCHVARKIIGSRERRAFSQVTWGGRCRPAGGFPLQSPSGPAHSAADSFAAGARGVLAGCASPGPPCPAPPRRGDSPAGRAPGQPVGSQPGRAPLPRRTGLPCAGRGSPLSLSPELGGRSWGFLHWRLGAKEPRFPRRLPLLGEGRPESEASARKMERPWAR